MTLTVPDSATVDAFRGVAVALGCLLIVALAVARFRADLPQRARALVYAAGLLCVPPLATEVQQIGKPFLIWRLPVTTVGFLCGLWWVVKVTGR